MPVYRATRWQKNWKISLYPGGFGRPVFIFPADPDQFRDIRQVVQGTGAVPELMLTPEPDSRQEQPGGG